MKEKIQALSNVQLELLKAFSFELNNEELQDFKHVIANYFAKRAVRSANKVWDEKGWNDNDMEKMLLTKMRKSQDK